MFSQGQILFAAIFFVAFVILIFYSYKKDLQRHRKHYKGSLFVLIGFLLFVALLFVIKYYLK